MRAFPRPNKNKIVGLVSCASSSVEFTKSQEQLLRPLAVLTPTPSQPELVGFEMPPAAALFGRNSASLVTGSPQPRRNRMAAEEARRSSDADAAPFTGRMQLPSSGYARWEEPVQDGLVHTDVVTVRCVSWRFLAGLLC